jgi:hypothetical protein
MFFVSNLPSSSQAGIQSAWPAIAVADLAVGDCRSFGKAEAFSSGVRCRASRCRRGIKARSGPRGLMGWKNCERHSPKNVLPARLAEGFSAALAREEIEKTRADSTPRQRHQALMSESRP